MSTDMPRQASFELPDSDHTALSIGSCDVAWEAVISAEMEGRLDAVLCEEMPLHSADSVFSEMRQRLRS